tara:strand:- start:73 stop:438 length:366 start_codon:yes stop_codon:yes gene_type:complete
MMKQTILKDKGFDIGLFVINTHEDLVNKGLDYKMSQRFLHFGTNIKVWIDDADKVPYDEIIKDPTEFLNSLSNARKYALETKKVIISLHETKFIDNEVNKKLTKLIDYILELLAQIIDKER